MICVLIKGLLNNVSASLASFRWVSPTERSSSTTRIPLFGIRFPDGGEEDFAELKNSFGNSVDAECIFSGFLINEPDVLVSVNGCPFSDSLDVSL